MSAAMELLPRAKLRDILAGRAKLVGSRLDPAQVRGLVSPVESRLALGLRYGDVLAEERSRLDESSGASSLRALAGAVVAGVLGKPSRSSTRRPYFVSTFVDALSIDEAVAAMFEPATAPRARMVHFVHAHAVNVAAFDAKLRETLAAADLLLPDGVGLRIAGRILGTAVLDNVNGTDLLPVMCRTAATKKVPLVLIGAAPGVAERCAMKLRASHPDLEIPIVQDGFLGEDEVPALVERIGHLGPAVVLVGMGTPRQEVWSRRWLAGLPGVTVVTVGGLFDFYSERIPRAPTLARELGLEWMFRLSQEPRRLAARYLLGNPLFLALVLLQRFGLLTAANPSSSV